MISKKSLLVVLLTCFCMLQNVSAQSDEAGSAYIVQLLYLNAQNQSAANAAMGVSLKYFADGKFYKINAMPGSLTRGLQYRGSPKMSFYDAGMPITEETVPALITDLGVAGKKVILLTKTSSGQHAAKVLDVENASFAPNTVRVLNFSQQPVRAKIDAEVTDLKPMAMNDFRVKNEKNRFLIRLAMAAQNGEETYLIENRRMGMRQAERKLILLYRKASDPDELTYAVYSIPQLEEAENFSDEDFAPIDPNQYDTGGYSTGTE